MASWYPSKINPLNGNFIKRHALALSKGHQVSVVHIYSGNQSENKVLVTKGDINEYVGIYAGSSFKFFRSAMVLFRVLRKIKKANGSIDIFFLNVFYPLGAHLIWLTMLYNAPFYALEHWTGYQKKYAKLPIHVKVAKFASRYCKGVLGVSAHLNNCMTKLGVSNVNGVLYNVVDESIFYYKPNSKAGDVFTFLHISNLKEGHKNFSLLLKAFAAISQNHNVRLTVVNSGNEQPYLELINTLGVNNIVSFKGVLNEKEIAALMHQSDAFVLSSDYENMPCVIAEALCCGLPVVSTNVGGISEIINHKNGLLVPPNNLIELAKAMEYLLLNIMNYNPEDIANNAKQLFSKMAILNKFNTIINA